METHKTQLRIIIYLFYVSVQHTTTHRSHGGNCANNPSLRATARQILSTGRLSIIVRMPTRTRKPVDRTRKKRRHIILRMPNDRLIFCWSNSVLYLHLTRQRTAYGFAVWTRQQTGSVPANTSALLKERRSIVHTLAKSGQWTEAGAYRPIWGGLCYDPLVLIDCRIEDEWVVKHEMSGAELFNPVQCLHSAITWRTTLCSIVAALSLVGDISLLSLSLSGAS